MKCGKGKCRFCLDEKIEYFYCRLCNDVSAVTEAQSQKYKCQRLLQCPICANVMNIIANQPKKDDPSKDHKHYHFNCSHCRWNSLHIDFQGETLNQLLMKFNFYKGKYQRSPQQLQFEKLFEIYKYNQEEHIKFEKFVLRSKKKTISYLNMQSNKRRPKYLKS